MSRRHGFDWEILGLDDDTWRLAVREHVCGVVTMMTMRRGPFEYYPGCAVVEQRPCVPCVPCHNIREWTHSCHVSCQMDANHL